jgi:hypothetical protein
MEDLIRYLRQATMESKLVVEKYLKEYPQLPLKDLIKFIKDERKRDKRILRSNDNL